jgi:hypothetical protein
VSSLAHRPPPAAKKDERFLQRRATASGAYRASRLKGVAAAALEAVSVKQVSWFLLALSVACAADGEPEAREASDAATTKPEDEAAAPESEDATSPVDAARGAQDAAADARPVSQDAAAAADAAARDAAPASDASVEAGTAGALVWPNAESRTNSDPWLVTHHDGIARLEPRVLVIDLEATAEARAMTLVDHHIKALSEASSFHKYKDPSAQPALVYQLVKVVHAPKGAERIDYGSWNTQAFADANLQIKDPADPSGPNLTLCKLFERGLINEVWCMASSDPKCGETQEAKQVYDASGQRIANRFANASNGDNITSLGCKVTARITDFNSGRGAGCHQHAMGHAWERYMDSSAVPQLAKQAKRFLNWDLNTRAGAPFSSFYSACNSNGAQLTDCIVWESMTRARSGASAARAFDIADMSAGCGNAHFYANTTGTYSYDANTPDPEVLASCENYGLHNGPGGKDLTTSYTNAMTDRYYGRSARDCPAQQPACDDDCGGHGSTYLYQNFPGPGTKATNDDGTPMHNWWVYLFY